MFDTIYLPHPHAISIPSQDQNTRPIISEDFQRRSDHFHDEFHVLLLFSRLLFEFTYFSNVCELRLQ